MCKSKRKISGHITVEVALLLPIIVFLIVWLVFFMVFLLDMAVVKSEVIRVSDEAAAIWDKDGDLPTGKYEISKKQSGLSALFSSGKTGNVQGKALSRLKKRVRTRLMLTGSHGQKVSVGRSKVSAQVSVRFSWPYPGGDAKILHGLEFTGKGVSPVDDWKDQMRLASAIRGLSK